MQRELIKRTKFPKRKGEVPLGVVLCYLPTNKHTPFVTWIQNTDTGDTFHGNYWKNYKMAALDFDNRVQKLINGGYEIQVEEIV